MVNTGCSQRAECPKVVYPKLEAIDRIPYYDYYVVDGHLDVNSTQRAFNVLRAYRVSENYYYKMISSYRKEFNQ